MNNLPICPTPTATNCQQPGGTGCDPTMGPCPNPVTTNPVNSFSRPFMSGAANFKAFLDKHGNKPGEFFFVSWAGHVYKVMYDSTGIMDAKAPACGQVILVPQLLTYTEATATNKAAYLADSMAMQTMPSTIIEAIEDQFAPGVPAWIDKVRDSYGIVENGAFVIEMRPVSADYGHTTMQCPAPGNVVNNPTCDPAKGPCGPVNTGFQPFFFNGAVETARLSLASSNNMVGIVKDSTGNVTGTATMDPATLNFDTFHKYVVVSMQNNPGALFAFLAPLNAPGSLLIKNNMALVVPVGAPTSGGTSDSGKVVVDSTRPPPYKGTLDNVRTLLTLKGFRVKVGSPNGLTDAAVTPESLQSDGTLTFAVDATTASKIYIFLGDKMDPTKPMVTPTGDIVVAEKATVAGL